MEAALVPPPTAHLITKKYTKKNGQEVVKKYDQNKYNAVFYAKHKQEINKKDICECGKEYTHGNISHHIKSQYHLLYKKLTTPINPII